jgi:hypothetical protein
MTEPITWTTQFDVIAHSPITSPRDDPDFSKAG